MKILVINGPNLNLLGIRDRKHYGTATLAQIETELKKIALRENAELMFFQNNHEGTIIDFLQKSSTLKASGILINPGALTHYSYSLRDALIDCGLPTMEIHLSDINNREEFRKIDVLDGVVIGKIAGLKEKSYFEGLKKLINFIKSK